MFGRVNFYLTLPPETPKRWPEKLFIFWATFFLQKPYEVMLSALLPCEGELSEGLRGQTKIIFNFPHPFPLFEGTSPSQGKSADSIRCSFQIVSDKPIKNPLQLAKPCGTPRRTILQLAKPCGTPHRIILQLAKPPGTPHRIILQLAKPPGTPHRIKFEPSEKFF